MLIWAALWSSPTSRSVPIGRRSHVRGVLVENVPSRLQLAASQTQHTGWIESPYSLKSTNARSRRHFYSSFCSHRTTWAARVAYYHALPVRVILVVRMSYCSSLLCVLLYLICRLAGSCCSNAMHYIFTFSLSVAFSVTDDKYVSKSFTLDIT